jgi:hypothetical protein
VRETWNTACLHRKGIIEQADSSYISSRPIEVRNKAKSNRIRDCGEDDRNARGRCRDCEKRGSSAGSNEYGGPRTNQIGG